jgi:hypothetical protein
METFTFTPVAVIGLTGVLGRASSTGWRCFSFDSTPSRMVPLSPSMVMGCPSSIWRVAEPLPTTAGTPSSRETMAAWEVIPPSSVTIPAARFIAGTMSGIVISATMMSPSATWSRWSSLVTMRAGPEAIPGLAPSPRRTTSPTAVSPLPLALVAASPSVAPDPTSSTLETAVSEMVVMGRDCSM